MSECYSAEMMRKPLSETHPELASEAHGWDPNTLTTGSSLKKEWKCKLGHIWFSTVAKRSSGQNCPYCINKRILVGFNDLKSINPALAAEASGWDPQTVSIGSSRKVLWKCTKKHEWEATVASRSAGAGCPFCSGNQVLSGLNDLSTKHPEIAKEAFGWDPATVADKSGKKLAWQCESGHQWKAIVASRVNQKTKCPVCSNRILLSGFNDLSTKHPEIAKEAFGWDPSKVSVGFRRGEWKCDLGHVWTALISSRLVGNGCPTCGGKQVLLGFNDLQSTYPNIASEAFGWNPQTVTLASAKIQAWKCTKGHKWKASVKHRTKRGDGCPICSGIKVLVGFNDLKTINPALAAEASGWDPQTVTISSGKKVLWQCVLGHKFLQRVADRKDNNECPICIGRKVLVGFNDLKTINPLLAVQAVNWDPTTVTAGSNRKSLWQCEFGHQWKATVSSRKTQGCPTCATHGFDPNSKGWLYFLNHPQWQMLQIGISNFPNDRLKIHKKLGWEEIELRGPMDGLIAREWETAILRMLKAKGADLSNFKIAGKFDGYSEAWSKTTFEVKSIKELMRLTEEFEEDV